MKNTSNPTRSTSPTTCEQESQTDSSENTNVKLKFFENFENDEHGYYTKWNGKKKKSPPSPPFTVGGVK